MVISLGHLYVYRTQKFPPTTLWVKVPSSANYECVLRQGKLASSLKSTERSVADSGRMGHEVQSPSKALSPHLPSG